jgi:hypothetical protein
MNDDSITLFLEEVWVHFFDQESAGLEGVYKVEFVDTLLVRF